MKKLMTAAALAMCASVYAVESANIVGYNTQAVNANTWYMIAPQFEDVNGTTTTEIDLLSVMKTEGLVAPTFAQRATASQIQVYDPATSLYNVYYYTSGTGGTGWRKSPAAPSTLPVKVGSGVWMKVAAAENASVTIAGQVRAVETTTVNVGDAGTWQIVSNPYPTALTQGKLTTTGLTAVPFAQRANASQIQVYDPTTSLYNVYYYTTGTGGTAWRKSPAAPASTDIVCPAGGAFWVKAVNPGTLQFSL